ncbi:kinase-like domain-containing protein [Rhexocercosporidium sp. MPI-PUGE-AT-0058]|nr:kinase-like domain-containing protein [Rhexocercosporidium sp. MPI-PUGE-AT-0058]
MFFLARAPRTKRWSLYNHYSLPKSRTTSCVSPLRKTRHHPDAQYLLHQLPQRKSSPLISYRSISSVSSSVLPIAHNEPLAPGATIQGHSGRTYTIEETIAERQGPLLCVYRASADGKKFIVKNMIPGDYEYQNDLQGSLSSCTYLRTMVDGVPGPDLFVYPYLETNLLQFSQNKLPDATRKDILKSALVGLAVLHEKNIIHSDIKPDNILLDYDIKDAAFHVKRVQIADLEDSVILPDGKHLKNTMCGSHLWRSPESWARAAQGTPSDIFSFGIVSIYVMLNDMVL